MKYKYNIKYKVRGKSTVKNFKNKRSMITYLDKNKTKVNKLDAVALNFGMVMLPLKQTVWTIQIMIHIIENSVAERRKCVLIYTDLRPSYSLIERCTLTNYERRVKNYAFGLNQANKKYILEENWN